MQLGYWNSDAAMRIWRESITEEEQLGYTDPVCEVLGGKIQNRSSRILDIGCGEGRLLPHVIPGNFEYVGIDNCDLIHGARQRKILGKREQEIHFYQRDVLEGIEFLGERRFDFILAVYCLHFISWSRNFERVIQEAIATMKSGGRFVFVGYTGDQQLLMYLENIFQKHGMKGAEMDIDSIPESTLIEWAKSS